MYSNYRFRGLAAALRVGLAALMCVAAAAQAQSTFQDPLDHPALQVSRPEKRPMLALAQAGERLVAVGMRGLVIISDDQGRSWKQAKVPVQSDLLAVHFPVPQTGWVVGHDGVVLRSDDGGASWTKQLDVRSAAQAFRQYYEQRASAGDAAAEQGFQLVDQNFREGTALPYLDVWFEDSEKGYAVGSYGLLIATVDGGKTWTPWFERIESGQFNLNSVRGIDGQVWVAGEQGRVHRLDRDKGRFILTNTGYAGSFFGMAGNGKSIIAYGLRGVVYRADAAGREWKQVTTPSQATISSGLVDSTNSRYLLVNAAGQILQGSPDGSSFEIVQTQQHPRLTGLHLLSGNAVALTGLTGVSIEPLGSSAAR